MESPVKTKSNLPSTRSSGDGEEDRISNLPEELVCHILSFLTTDEAFKTSVLSKQWKSLWNTLPDFSFEFRGILSPHLNYESFVHFVRNVLDSRIPPHHQGIRKFKLNFSAPYFWPRQLFGFIPHAIRCHAQELDIQLHSNPLPQVPQGFVTYTFFPFRVFSSEKLTTLKLHSNFSFHSHSFSPSPWLPSLKVLDLNFDHQLCDEPVSSLLPGCPVLVELHLIGTYNELEIRAPNLKILCATLQCGWKARLEIDAPSLEYLSLSDWHPANYVIKNLNNVMEARLSIEVYSFGIYQGDRKSLFDLLSGIFNVKSLHLSLVNREACIHWILQDLDLPETSFHSFLHEVDSPVFQISELRHSLPEFPNLVSLHLQKCCVSDLLPRFLEKSPKLETPIIIEESYQGDASCTNRRFLQVPYQYLQ